MITLYKNLKRTFIKLKYFTYFYIDLYIMTIVYNINDDGVFIYR